MTARSVPVTRTRSIMRFRMVCCSGYSGIHPDCRRKKQLNQAPMPFIRCVLIAICSPPCVNGGTCDAPSTCNCPAGWTGQDCSSGKYKLVMIRMSCNSSTDINECASDTPPCGQICTNTLGSYQCSCRNGYVSNGSACDG